MADAKLAARTADRIIGDIAELGWPEGQLIGSEADLLERYAVSRAVLREAITLVERHGVARMRLGAGGGLVVAGLDVRTVADAVSVYLLFVGAGVGSVLQAQATIEGAVAALAADRIDESTLVALRDRSASGGPDVRPLVVTASGNLALEFFLDLLAALRSRYAVAAGSTTGAYGVVTALDDPSVIDAVVGGDGDLARRRARQYLDPIAVGAAALPSLAGLSSLAAAAGTDGKLARRVASAVVLDIVGDGWPVGHCLGSERVLSERFGVSRGVLREAVSILEHYRVARMRRGPGGGLFVDEPDLDAVASAAARYVERRGICARQLLEVREAVELEVLGTAVAAFGPRAADRLTAALEAEDRAAPEDFAAVGHEFHRIIAGLAGSPVLEVVVQILVHVTRLRLARYGNHDDVPFRQVTAVHRGIVEAMAAGDHQLARYRMQRHLEALVEWAG